MSVAMPAASRAPARWRWLPRGGGALLVSIAAHGLAAVTAGGVLALGRPQTGEEHPAALVELELAAEGPVADAPAAAGAAPLAAAPVPVRAHPAPRRRLAMPPAAVARLTEPSVTPAAVPTAESAPRFVMSAGAVVTRVPDAVAVRGGVASSGSLDAASAPGGTLGEGDVNQPARLVAPSPPVYPAAARAAEIELDFPIEIVVDTAGRVASARPLRRAGYGLDEAAMRAIRDYRFAPAMRAGRAVPVRMRWTVQFRLR